MTYAEFYDKLVQLSLFSPTDAINDTVLNLLLALDDLQNADDDAGAAGRELLADIFG